MSVDEALCVIYDACVRFDAALREAGLHRAYVSTGTLHGQTYLVMHPEDPRREARWCRTEDEAEQVVDALVRAKRARDRLMHVGEVG
jgi:hypothetical protein